MRNTSILSQAAFCVVIVTIILPLQGCKNNSDAAIRKAANAIARAKTTHEEQEAFVLTHRTTHSYKIQFLDGTGAEIKPQISGDYSIVANMKVTWNNGHTVTAPLRDIRNLNLLMAE